MKDNPWPTYEIHEMPFTDGKRGRKIYEGFATTPYQIGQTVRLSSTASAEIVEIDVTYDEDGDITHQIVRIEHRP